MFEGIRKKTVVNFTIFVLGLVVLTLVGSAYLNYFQNDRYDANIVDTIAEKHQAEVGNFNKSYKGLETKTAVLNIKSLTFKDKYKFTDFNDKERSVDNAIIINNGVSYNTVKKFLKNGGHFSVLDKKGNEILAQMEMLVESADENSTKLVLALGTDDEPYYLLVHGIKINTNPTTKRVFKIQKQK